MWRAGGAARRVGKSCESFPGQNSNFSLDCYSNKVSHVTSFKVCRRRSCAAGRSGARRGAVKSAALRGTLALLTKIPFIPLFIQPPRKAGVSKEAKMDEKFEPVIQPYLYKIEITTMRNSYFFFNIAQMNISASTMLIQFSHASFKVHVL